MVDNKRLEYLESMYQDKCCITQMDKDVQSIIKELKEYRAADDKHQAKKPVVKLGVRSIDFIEYEDGHREAKPKIENQYTCPGCGGYISRLLIISDKYVASKKKRYCDRCGQKLDWSD